MSVFDIVLVVLVVAGFLACAFFGPSDPDNPWG